jgi:hypothetical protein
MRYRVGGRPLWKWAGVEFGRLVAHLVILSVWLAMAYVLLILLVQIITSLK